MSDPTYYRFDQGGAAISVAHPLPVALEGGGGGAVTIADGSDATQGAIADAAYVSGSGTIVSILKGIFGKLPVSLGAKTAATSLSVAPATDAVFATAARNMVFWPETSTPLAASATFNGASRDVGAASPGPVTYAYFSAMIYADQTGTATLERSNDGTNWTPAATAAIVASTPLTLQVPVVARYHRIVVENGGTLQTVLSVNSGYSAS